MQWAAAAVGIIALAILTGRGGELASFLKGGGGGGAVGTGGAPALSVETAGTAGAIRPSYTAQAQLTPSYAQPQPSPGYAAGLATQAAGPTPQNSSGGAGAGGLSGGQGPIVGGSGGIGGPGSLPSWGGVIIANAGLAAITAASRVAPAGYGPAAPPAPPAPPSPIINNAQYTGGSGFGKNPG